MTSGISLHVLYDGIDSDVNPLRVALASLRPRVINIVGGARKTQAFTFAIEMKKKYPSMRVIFRSWPDDGNHAKDRYKLICHRDTFGNLIVDDASGCQRWLDDHSNYLLAGLTVLTDNESMRGDLDVYSEWQARIMDLAGAKGWSVAVGRFATGNPPKAQLPQLNSMFRTLLKWGDLHCFSPNEYFSKDPTRNGGNVYRYQDAVDYAKSIGAWPFPVNIGEFGMLVMDAGGRLDPEAGFKDSKIGMSHKDVARFTINTWADWYKAEDVDVCIYCWGGDGTPKWERCRIDNDVDFLKVLLDAAAIGELEVVTKAVTKPFLTPMPKPENASDAIRIRVTNVNGVNLRSGASTDYQQSRLMNKGDEVTLYRKPFKQDDKGQVWRWVDYSLIEGGWVCTDVLTYTDITPPVVIPPPPPSVPFLEISSELAARLASNARALSAAKLASANAHKAAAETDLLLAQEYLVEARTWDNIASATTKAAQAA